MNKSVKIMTGFVSFFMLIPGLVKFTEPFKRFFHTQITQSEMPFPVLAKVFGQGGEILVGIALVVLLFFWNRFEPKLASKVFVLANSMAIGILLVAIYVHLHPAVPAEVLPGEIKPPFLSISLSVMAAFNIYLANKAGAGEKQLN